MTHQGHRAERRDRTELEAEKGVACVFEGRNRANVNWFQASASTGSTKRRVRKPGPISHRKNYARVVTVVSEFGDEWTTEGKFTERRVVALPRDFSAQPRSRSFGCR